MSWLRGGLAVILVAVAIAGTSCSRIEEPKVVLREISGGRLSSEGMELDLIVDVENPNGFGAQIGRMEYTIIADGKEIVEGRRSEKVSVPANGSAEVSIPFIIKWSGAGRLLEAILDGEEHSWKVEGEVVLHKGPVSRTFRFSESERLRAPADIDE